MKLNKKLIGVGAAIISLLLVAALAIAHGPAYNQDSQVAPGTFHEQMEEVMENGNYEDLEALRAETGMSMMPFVTDQETFAQMQERHEEMEAYWEENGIAPGPKRGMMGSGDHGMMGQGARGGYHGNCPMMS